MLCDSRHDGRGMTPLTVTGKRASMSGFRSYSPVMSGSGSTPTGYSAFSAGVSRHAARHPHTTRSCEFSTRRDAEDMLDRFKTDDNAVFLEFSIPSDSKHVESIVDFLASQ